MENELSFRLPFYYEVGVDRGIMVHPFFVSPLPASQSTLLLGPRTIASEHAEFTDRLFKNFAPTRQSTPLVRCFRFKLHYCFAIILSTKNVDEFGRPGQAVAMGCLIDYRLNAELSTVAAAFVKGQTDVLNSVFGFDLPEHGTDELIRLASEAYKNSQQPNRFGIVAASWLAIAKAAGAIKKRSVWSRYLASIRSRHLRKASLLLYPAGMLWSDLLGVIGNTGVDRTALLREGDISELEPPDLLVVSPYQHWTDRWGPWVIRRVSSDVAVVIIR